ncbi:MAG: hypothetical protein [Caudoviricetes sp.]|nr:MAG: hypothetical protein [Caudoviricetes sp.]
MNILTEYNEPYSTNNIDEDTSVMFFNVIDYSNPKTADYKFYPLFSLEKFTAPAIELSIGGKIISVPMDWSIVIGDKHSGELEVFPIKKLIDRSFDAFCINPISGFMPDFLELDILNIFPDMKWQVPTLRNNHFLSVPITNTTKPLCVFLSSPTTKVPDILEIENLV